MREHSFGALVSPKDIRDYKLNAAIIQSQEFPNSFYLQPIQIKNQGIQSTCVAHALASLVEFFNYRDTSKNDVFSTDFIYGCRMGDDYFGEGMYLRDGLKIIQKYGDVLYIELSGNSDVVTAYNKVQSDFENLCLKAAPNRISTYYKIQSLNELKYSLLHNGPVPCIMKWFQDATISSKGVYEYTNTKIKDYHAVLIIGWNEQYLILQNSWGSKWGDNGLFYIPIQNMNKIFYELYGVTDNISEIVKPKTFTLQFGPYINILFSIMEKINHLITYRRK